MNINSEYYNSFEKNIEKFEISEEAVPYALENFQGTEEQIFSFAMFLLM
ncbi:MAG: hypothetical protein RR614_00500 [Eubacterium sp.]